MPNIKRVVVEYDNGQFWFTHPHNQYTISPTRDKTYPQYLISVAVPVEPDEAPPGRGKIPHHDYVPAA